MQAFFEKIPEQFSGNFPHNLRENPTFIMQIPQRNSVKLLASYGFRRSKILPHTCNYFNNEIGVNICRSRLRDERWNAHPSIRHIKSIIQGRNWTALLGSISTYSKHLLSFSIAKPLLVFRVSQFLICGIKPLPKRTSVTRPFPINWIIYIPMFSRVEMDVIKMIL